MHGKQSNTPLQYLFADYDVACSVCKRTKHAISERKSAVLEVGSVTSAAWRYGCQLRKRRDRANIDATSPAEFIVLALDGANVQNSARSCVSVDADLGVHPREHYNKANYE